MPDKIKICYILSHLPQGGAERQTLNLIKGLDSERYDITLILYASTEIFYKEVTALPVRLIINPASDSNKLMRNLRHAISLRRSLRRQEYDLLHTMLFHNGFWVRLLAPGRYNGRILYSIRNTIDESPLHEKLAEKLVAFRSVVVTNSFKVLNQYIDLVGEKYRPRVHNIYNGIDVQRFEYESIPETGDRIVIGTVGRQTALKNQIQILRAIREVCKTEPVHLYIIGDKSKESYIENERFVDENQLRGTVEILDSQANIEDYYRRFNIFVLSSVNESCPNSLLEAMLSRSLCIVSAGSNPDHYISEGINGFVYDGSLEMLTEKLYQAISLVRSRGHHEIVNNGCEYVKTNFSYVSMVNAYDGLYNDMLDDKRSGQ